jgi:hypothetical protein
MALLVPMMHRWAGRASISVQELDGEDFIGYTPDLTIRKQIDRWLKQSKVSVNIVHEFDNIENIKLAVEVGSGVAILPVPTVRREVEAGSLALITFEDVTWLRPLGIVHKRHKTLSNAVQKFIELLHQDPATFPKGGPGAAAPAAGTARAGAAGAKASGHDAPDDLDSAPHAHRLPALGEPREKKRNRLSNLR